MGKSSQPPTTTPQPPTPAQTHHVHKHIQRNPTFITWCNGLLYLGSSFVDATMLIVMKKSPPQNPPLLNHQRNNPYMLPSPPLLSVLFFLPLFYETKNHKSPLFYLCLKQL